MTNLTRDQIEAIRKGTAGATPGPWLSEITPDYCEISASGVNIAMVQGSYETGPHIANCDPDTIARLCDMAAECITLTADLARARKALEQMLHAVCHETGFAAVVRNHSGIDYPWPALDLAEDEARATLAAIAPVKEMGK